MVAAITGLEQQISVLAPVVAALVGIYVKLRNQDKKTAEIHVLVNNRLEQALEEIRQLKERAALESPSGSVSPTEDPSG